MSDQLRGVSFFSRDVGGVRRITAEPLPSLPPSEILLVQHANQMNAISEWLLKSKFKI